MDYRKDNNNKNRQGYLWYVLYSNSDWILHVHECTKNRGGDKQDSWSCNPDYVILLYKIYQKIDKDVSKTLVPLVLPQYELSVYS